MIWFGKVRHFQCLIIKQKKGATEAMIKHKKKEKKEHDDMYKGDRKPSGRWDSFQRWSVDKFELEILP